MSANELAARIQSLSPEQRCLVESFLLSLDRTSHSVDARSLADHPSFGAWAQRHDLAADSDDAARDLRRQAAQRESA